MQKPKPTSEYEHGQMMGMLVMITTFENMIEHGIPFTDSSFDKIKGIAAQDLSEYLKIPEEDVHLLVDKQIKEPQQ